MQGAGVGLGRRVPISHSIKPSSRRSDRGSTGQQEERRAEGGSGLKVYDKLEFGRSTGRSAGFGRPATPEAQLRSLLNAPSRPEHSSTEQERRPEPNKGRISENR